MNASPEAKAIADKLKKSKGVVVEEIDEPDDGDSVSSEAKTAAAEAVFKAIRGREPTDEEAKATEDALSTYMEACGY